MQAPSALIDMGLEDEEFKMGLTNLALQIEVAIFKHYSKNGVLYKDYMDKARSIIFNLKDPQNMELRMKLISGDIQPSALVKMSAQEMASSEKKKERQMTIEASLAANRTDWMLERAKTSGKGMGFFTCKKCGSKKTTYFQMQTRGADEPMTNFVACLDCRNQWKC